MLDFEKYLSDFNSTIDIADFFVNFLIVAVIAFIIQQFYIKYSNALSDRRKFAQIFMPLALATLLIITVIKSSIALSLGLVGALSIVRFRAAIKDPEELTYLFLVIGLGIVGGAGKPLLALLSFAVILPILYLHQRFSSTQKSLKGKTHINIKTTHSNTADIVNGIETHVTYLELKRVDHSAQGNFYGLVSQIKSIEDIEHIKSAILNLDPQATISIVDQPEVIL
jgi:hypothetical protein